MDHSRARAYEAVVLTTHVIDDSSGIYSATAVDTLHQSYELSARESPARHCLERRLRTAGCHAARRVTECLQRTRCTNDVPSHR